MLSYRRSALALGFCAALAACTSDPSESLVIKDLVLNQGATAEDLMARYGNRVTVSGNTVSYLNDLGVRETLQFTFAIPTRGAIKMVEDEGDNLPYALFEHSSLSAIPGEVVTALCRQDWRMRVDEQTGRTEYNPCHMPEMYRK